MSVGEGLITDISLVTELVEFLVFVTPKGTDGLITNKPLLLTELAVDFE